MSFLSHIAALRDALFDEGVRHAFGVSGGGPSLELVTALEERGVRFYPASHEAAAAMMAGAASSHGRTRALAVSIRGPGFANMLPGMLANAYEHRPALTISEAFGPATPPDRMHKRLDHRASSQPMVKAHGVSDADGRAVRELLLIAQRETPGPVHLDLSAEPAGASENEFGVRAAVAPSGPDAVRAAHELIRASARPAFVLGSAAVRLMPGFAWGSLGIPVATTAAAKGAIDETGAHAAGVVTGEVKELSPESTVLARADCVIGIGLRNTEVVQAKPFAAPCVIVDVGEAARSEGWNARAALTVPDLSAAVGAIAPLIRGKEWGGEVIRDARERIAREFMAHEWMPANVFRRLNGIHGATLVLDTGLFCTVGETVWRARTPREFLGASNGRFMGTAIPTAIGFAIGNPERRVISVMGDGGIRPYLAELQLAAEERLPILFVLMSDGHYGTFAASAIARGMSRRAYEIPRPSFWRAVGAMGIRAAEARDERGLDAAIAAWESNREPFFLDLAFDPARYRTMTARLR